MPTKTKKPNTTDREVKVMKSSAARGRLGDTASKKAQGLGKTLGNSGVAQKVDQSSKTRDELLQFVMARLQTVRQVQDKELQEMGDVREWYKQVASGASGYHLPDPTRWHLSARLYQQAGNALADGHLGRAAGIIDKALEAERAAFDSVPKQVQEELSLRHRQSIAPPDILAYVTSNLGCAATSRPKGLDVAELVLNVTATMKDSPPMQTQRRWWDEPAQEEGEALKDAAKKDAAKTADPKKDGAREMVAAVVGQAIGAKDEAKKDAIAQEVVKETPAPVAPLKDLPKPVQEARKELKAAAPKEAGLAKGAEAKKPDAKKKA